MEEDIQWVVENIENESGVAPALVADDDSCTELEQPAETKNNALKDKNPKKRARLQKMKAASKRHRQERHNQNPMHGVELLDPEQQALAFQSLLNNTSNLEQVESSDFIEIPTEKQQREITNLPHTVKAIQADWIEKLLGKQSPGGVVLLVLTYSATRAVQIVKVLRQFQTKNLPVAKLFAKHMKIEEQIKLLEGDVRIAVGTPNRVLKLFDAGALASTQLEHVIIDMGLDAKNFNLFDIDAVRADFLTLFDKYLASTLKSQRGKSRLCLY